MRWHLLPLLVLVIAPAAARADTEDEMWGAEGSVAAGMVVGRLAWDGPGDVHLAAMFAAPAITVAAFVGPAAADGVVFGLGVDASLVLGANTWLAQTEFEHGYELAATVAAVRRSPGVAWRAGLGVAVSGFVGGGTSDGSAAVDFDTLLGPVARASLAWPLSPGLAFAVEVRAGYLFAGHLCYVPVTLLAALHF